MSRVFFKGRRQREGYRGNCLYEIATGRNWREGCSCEHRDADSQAGLRGRAVESNQSFTWWEFKAEFGNKQSVSEGELSKQEGRKERRMKDGKLKLRSTLDDQANDRVEGLIFSGDICRKDWQGTHKGQPRGKMTNKEAFVTITVPESDWKRLTHCVSNEIISFQTTITIGSSLWGDHRPNLDKKPQ